MELEKIVWVNGVYPDRRFGDIKILTVQCNSAPATQAGEEGREINKRDGFHQRLYVSEEKRRNLGKLEQGTSVVRIERVVFLLNSTDRSTWCKKTWVCFSCDGVFE